METGASHCRRRPLKHYHKQLQCTSPSTVASSLDSKHPAKARPGQSSFSSGSGSWVSPDWLTSLTPSLSLQGNDDSGIPVASAKLEDVSGLFGGVLFLPLFKWMKENGPIYRLASGPRDFVVVSDPAIAKHVLRKYGKYAKGLVAEVLEFLFGSRFAIAQGPLWTMCREIGGEASRHGIGWLCREYGGKVLSSDS